MVHVVMWPSGLAVAQAQTKELKIMKSVWCSSNLLQDEKQNENMYIDVSIEVV